MFRHLFKLLLLSFFFVGCAVTAPSVNEAKVSRLSKLLQGLDMYIPKEEADQLSQDIYHKTRQLTKEFELTSPPQYHNFLVNAGLREKGLCYHWSDTLYLYLSQKSYPSFELHLMGANIGEYWSEHNALVIVNKGGRVEGGIIIDAWRNSGEVYFSKVSQDTKYQWKHRTQRGCLR